MCVNGSRACQECGKPLAAHKDPRSIFCSGPCRMTWNNRRGSRGSDIYDLVMAWRYERPVCKALGLFTLLCRMARVWHEEDKHERDGRRSYTDPDTALSRATKYRADHY